MLIARLLVAVTGAGMALVLAVVLLIYAIYVPQTPQLVRDLPTLALTLLAFTLLGGIAIGSALGNIRSWPRKRVWDVALLAALPICVGFLWRVYA